MAVAIAGSAEIAESATGGHPTTYTAAAGSNRLLLCLFDAEDTGNTIVSIKFGTTVMTEGLAFYESAQDSQTFAYYLKEADIPAGAQAIDVTWGGANADDPEWVGMIYTLTDVDQTTPVDDSASENEASATTWTGPSVTSTDDGAVFALCGTGSNHSAASSITTANWTTDAVDYNISGYDAMFGHKFVTTGAAETPVADWNGTAETGVFGMLAIAVVAAAGANPKGPLGMPLHGPFGGPI